MSIQNRTMPKPLIPEVRDLQQRKFCEEVAKGASLTDAYIRAGFNHKNRKSARSMAAQLRKKPEITGLIAELSLEIHHAKATYVNKTIEEFGPLDDDVFTRLGRAKAIAKRRQEIVQTIKARGEHLMRTGKIVEVPGGSLGWVAYKEKMGKIECTIDIAPSEHMLHLEEQIARELGQWVEKQDQTVSVRSMDDLPDEVIHQIRLQAEKVAAENGIQLTENQQPDAPTDQVQ